MPNANSKRLAGPQWKHVIGLTGGFGSGKSTVIGFLKKRGIKTLDADGIVHRLLEDAAVRRKILKAFRVLDKKALAKIVFASAAKRRKLEGILHPLVEKSMRAELKKTRGNVAVADVPLLFEGGWENRFDGVIFIDAPLKKRIARLKKRGFSKPEIAARMRAQWPVAKKKKGADVVVNNNGSVGDLKNRINDLTF